MRTARRAGLALSAVLVLNVAVAAPSTTLASASICGGASSGEAAGAAISATGRYTAFSSTAADIVPGDSNRAADIFRHDSALRTTVRASISSAGLQANGGSFQPAVSADGRFVAFSSDATNLVPGDFNGARDVFVRDFLADTVERVSMTASGGESDGPSFDPAISADGRIIAFSSLAGNMSADDPGSIANVFVRDRLAGTTVKISQPYGPSRRTNPGLAYDANRAALVLFGGRSVVNLGDTWERRNNAWTEGTNPAPPGRRSGAIGYVAGKVVIFGGEGSAGLLGDMWEWDGAGWVERTVSRPSPRAFAATAADPVGGSLLVMGGASSGSPLGETWSWNGLTWNLLDDDAGLARQEAALALIEPSPGQKSYLLFGGRGPAGLLADTRIWTGSSWQLLAPSATPTARAGAAFVPDGAGGAILFGGEGAHGKLEDTWHWTVDGGWEKLQPSRSPSRRTGPGFTFDAERGKPLLFGGTGTAGPLSDLWEWTGSTWHPLSATGWSVRPALSANGTTVAFTSYAGNLTTADANGTSDIFLAPTSGNQVPTLVTRSTTGASANGASDHPSLSVEGRYVAFDTLASDFLVGDSNGVADIYLVDRSNDKRYRLSIGLQNAQPNGPSLRPSLSADGRMVSFESSATNLVTGDINARKDVFAKDRSRNTIEQISVDSNGVPANDTSDGAAMSQDGLHVAFSSKATNLGPGATLSNCPWPPVANVPGSGPAQIWNRSRVPLSAADLQVPL